MIQPVNLNPPAQPLITMADMQPYDIGVVVDGNYDGHIVMRSASSNHVEIFSLSDPTGNFYWGSCTNKVRLLQSGESITLTVA